MARMVRVSDESDGWQTDGSCGTHWEEPPDCEDLRCRESGYFTPNISSDSDVEEDMSYEDGMRAHTSMPTPPLSPKSPSATPSACSLHHEVLGKRLRDAPSIQLSSLIHLTPHLSVPRVAFHYRNQLSLIVSRHYTL